METESEKKVRDGNMYTTARSMLQHSWWHVTTRYVLTNEVTKIILHLIREKISKTITGNTKEFPLIRPLYRLLNAATIAGWTELISDSLCVGVSRGCCNVVSFIRRGIISSLKEEQGAPLKAVLFSLG